MSASINDISGIGTKNIGTENRAIGTTNRTAGSPERDRIPARIGIERSV
jgi:hypothetical protein